MTHDAASSRTASPTHHQLIRLKMEHWPCTQRKQKRIAGNAEEESVLLQWTLPRPLHQLLLLAVAVWIVSSPSACLSVWVVLYLYTFLVLLCFGKYCGCCFALAVVQC